MLTELRIANFAIVEQLGLSLQSGFTVLTGETGGGKSLLIDAIALLVGGRASNDQIRFGADEAELEACFQIPPDHPLLSRLRAQDLLGPQDCQVIIRRIIARSGRNRVYINGVMSPVHMLDAFGGTLVDVHGQHDQQSLLSSSTQLEVLDAFGHLEELREAYRSANSEWGQSRRERDVIAARIQEARQHEDYLQFQRQELDDAAVRRGEEEALQSELLRLRSFRRVSELVSEAHERLQGDGVGVLPTLAVIERSLEELANIDADMQGVSQMAIDAKVLLKETADALRGYTDRLENDPQRLGAIEDRLALIQKLKKKYGGTVESVLETHQRVREELTRLECSDAELEQHDRRIAAKRQAVARVARQLSAKRKDAAKRMTKMVRQELHALKMEQTQFAIQLVAGEQDEDFGETEWTGQTSSFQPISATLSNPLLGSLQAVNCLESCWR
jgi:DNA repair protein RecN (Recombination protein N)